VGRDVSPGRYLSAGTTTGQCTWTRRAAGNAVLGTWTGRGRAIVEVLPSDARVDSTGCGTFTLAPAGEQPNPATSVSEGTWRTGWDMAPGRWTTDGPTGPDACTWARLRDFLSTPSSVIASGSAARGDVVEVLGTDAGFLVQGCSWSATA
jgi:hypothetical protein